MERKNLCQLHSTSRKGVIKEMQHGTKAYFNAKDRLENTKNTKEDKTQGMKNIT